MRLGRSFVNPEPEQIQMVPLIDILFVTLFFFLVVSAYSSMESDIDITLPTANSAVQTTRSPGEIYINVRKDGKVVLNDHEMDISELQGVLNRVADLYPGGSVIIRGDRDTALGNAVAILNCCRNADIPNVSFAALPEETKNGQ